MKPLRTLLTTVASVGIVAGIGPTGCTSPLPSGPWPNVRVNAVGFRFSPGEDVVTSAGPRSVAWPKQLVLPRGSWIVFQNLDAVAHTLTSDTCVEGRGFREPKPPGKLADVSDAFDDRVGPAVFGEPSPEPHAGGRCLFDSRGENVNGFTNTGEKAYLDTSGLWPGVYRFHCLLHEFMQGTLRVTDAKAS